MERNDEEKWNAIVRCDPSFDGKFFYGVKTTRIFCRPSCNSKQPLRENVLFFKTAEDAAAHGFRPCKRCRPDLSDYRPMEELFQQAKQIYDTCYDDGNRLEEKLAELNVSRNHLIRSFHSRFGVAPVEYINRLRVEKAASLLRSSAKPILEIALACGFGSLSVFYVCFKKQTGVTPGEYRSMPSEK